MLAQKRARTKRGFTLTELAIVLSIVCVLFGAIWTATRSVSNSQLLVKASTQIATITQAVSALFATSAQTGYVPPADMTSDLTNAGVFPSDMVVAGGINNPWNPATAATTVKSATVVSAQDGYELILSSLPTYACTGLLSSLGQAAVWGGTGNYPGNATNMPMSTASITTACTVAVPLTLHLVFKIRP